MVVSCLQYCAAMTKLPVLLTSLVLATTLVACGSKKKEGEGGDPAPAAKASEPKAADPAPAEAKPAAPAPSAKLVETDLSKFGPAFKGYVAMIPEGAKLEFDDPSRHITLSDTDFVSISEAPYWEDGVASLAKDPDNKKIEKIGDNTVKYERTPPLGTAWAVDVLVKLGKDKFSCTAGDPGTFTSAAMRDSIEAICKSIKKK